MPLPKPSKGEKEDDFIERCMIFQDEDGKFDLKNKKDREQALAICYSQYRRNLGESTGIKTMNEILNGD